MNIIIDKKQFLKQLSIADSVTSTRSSIPVLSNVLIEGNSGNLFVTASNLETGIKVSGNAKVEDEGSIVVNGKKIISIVKELPEDNILLKSEDNKLTIKSLNKKINARFTVLGMGKENFPVVKTDMDERGFTVNSDLFKNMIRKVIFSISSDETKYALTGVFIEIYDNYFNMVATDGKRLALVRKELEEIGMEEADNLVPEDGAIVPKTALLEVLRYNFEDELVTMGFSKSQIFLEYDNVNVVSNLIEGKFPDYKRIIPVDREKYFIVDKEALFGAIKRVSVLVDESLKKVKLSILPGKMIVSAQSPTMGGAEEEIPIVYDGEDIDIALNYQYLIDCLREIDSDEVVIDFEDSERAITVKGKEEKGYLNIIMPMKINF